MRNVTIVESNVEPNKEHLWFYNGKLKWFGPNGWEDVCACKFPSLSSTTTTTPKSVVTTTTTTSTPKPGPTPIPNSIKLTNRTKVSLILTRVNWVDNGTSSPPIQPNQQHILVHNANDANNDSYIEIYVTPESDALLPFSSLKITAFNNEGQEYDVPYEHYQDAMGINLYKFSFKELINKGVTEVFIYGSLENSATTSTLPSRLQINARVDNGLNYAIDISDFDTSASIPAKTSNIPMKFYISPSGGDLAIDIKAIGTPVDKPFKFKVAVIWKDDTYTIMSQAFTISNSDIIHIPYSSSQALKKLDMSIFTYT